MHVASLFICRHSPCILHCLDYFLKAQLWLCNFPICVHLPYLHSNRLSLCWHSRPDNVIVTYILGHISPFYSKLFSIQSGLLMSLFLFVSFNPLGITFVSCCATSLYTCIQAWINLPPLLLSKFCLSFPIQIKCLPCFLLRIPRLLHFNTDHSTSSTHISCYLTIHHDLSCCTKLVIDESTVFSFSYMYVLSLHLVNKVLVARNMPCISFSIC